MLRETVIWITGADACFCCAIAGSEPKTTKPNNQFIMTYLIPAICLIRFSPWFSLSEVCIRRVIAVPMSVYKVVAWSNAVLTIIAYRGSHRLRGYKGVVLLCCRSKIGI